ncbi:excalibur calcium-binding domain-containing protein [Paenibacillus sp. IHBB 10380]|uniref:excalibur calcium-binding domain-containing protein n=1 Tax=Paenibacillus sp. IHBB 10380 TaxID=1566358 RepID=UPI0006961D39|nr:excalibur calcium-binding domain-containing protein [Paenibacillus sp. IHBB 10380]
METFTTILILLSMVGIILGIVGVIKGSIKFLRIKGRKNSLFLVIAFFVLATIGGTLAPVDKDNSTVALQNNASQKEKAVVTSTISEKSDGDSVKTTDNKQVVVAPSTTPKEVTTKEEKKAIQTPSTPTGILTVHYIDVGQGASQLILTPSGKTMLIDGGNNDDEQRIVNYLKKQGVKKVDILIGTHPDADHIGGLDAVVNAFEIGSIYMPKVSSNTKTFESLLTSIANKNLKVTTAKAGIDLKLDDQLIVNMIAPVNTYDDTNDMSAVIKITFGSNSFLFTGDAEAKSEKDLLANGTNLKSDVLLVGHHGSNSSTSQSFLNAVNPAYAVIQVGENNYGHPTSNILKRLADKKIKIYRNDEQGNIIFTSDGKKITTSQSESKTTIRPTVTEAPSATPKVAEVPKQSAVIYANCTAVREAGKAPLHKGDAGYSTKLDRDGDGVACESSSSSTTQTKPKTETPVVKAPKKKETTNVYYKNCTAVRDAGADPIYEGEPGYSRKLDRDGDGVACE